MKPKLKCEFRDINTAPDGYRARITLIDEHSHGTYRSGNPSLPTGTNATTSPVLRIDFEQGIIETESTIYTFENNVFGFAGLAERNLRLARKLAAHEGFKLVSEHGQTVPRTVDK